MVFHEYKAIQLHIGRTGGTSVEMAFGFKLTDMTRNEKHWRPREIIAAEGQTVWNSYFKFSFVRNPWDRVVSKFFFERDILKRLAPDFTFEQFVSRLHKEHGRWNPWDQFSWFQGRLGEFDFVGRFETLHADFRYLCVQLGADLVLPHKVATNHEHYSAYYDDKLRKQVAKMAKADIKTFGYTFEKR